MSSSTVLNLESFWHCVDLPPENETTGYIFIYAEGGLNQQRIAVRSCSVISFLFKKIFFLPIFAHCEYEVNENLEKMEENNFRILWRVFLGAPEHWL